MRVLILIITFVIICSNVFAQKVTLYENYEAYKNDKYKYYEEIDEFKTTSELNESIDTNYYRVYYKFDLVGSVDYYTFCVRLHKGRELVDEVITILDRTEDTDFWGYLNIKKGSGYRIIVYREDKEELLTSSIPFGVY
ncbi:MAG: hypothetical protein ISS16_03665 [Ignavibacteria bacterium]|nr:hypothetical protein [Ignavibacteria bacterium]